MLKDSDKKNTNQLIQDGIMNLLQHICNKSRKTVDYLQVLYIHYINANNK